MVLACFSPLHPQLTSTSFFLPSVLLLCRWELGHISRYEKKYFVTRRRGPVIKLTKNSLQLLSPQLQSCEVSIQLLYFMLGCVCKIKIQWYWLQWSKEDMKKYSTKRKKKRPSRCWHWVTADKSQGLIKTRIGVKWKALRALGSGDNIVASWWP